MSSVGLEAPVTIRFAFPDDACALSRLATLDSSEVPQSPVLLCEVGGELRAALSLADEKAIADPFFPTVQLVDLLRARAQQLRTTRASKRHGTAPSRASASSAAAQ